MRERLDGLWQNSVLTYCVYIVSVLALGYWACQFTGQIPIRQQTSFMIPFKTLGSAELLSSSPSLTSRKSTPAFAPSSNPGFFSAYAL